MAFGLKQIRGHFVGLKDAPERKDSTQTRNRHHHLNPGKTPGFTGTRLYRHNSSSVSAVLVLTVQVGRNIYLELTK